MSSSSSGKDKKSRIESPDYNTGNTQLDAALVKNYTRNRGRSGKIAAIVAGALALATVTGIGGYQLGSDGSPSAAPKPAASQVQSQQEAPSDTKDLQSMTDEEAQKSAADAALGILNDAATKDGKFEDRVKAIDSGDISSVPDSVKDKVRISGTVKEDEHFRNIAYETIVAISALTSDNGKEIKLSEPDAYQAVQVDKKTGIAYVPIGIFAGKSVPLTFEMVWVDGEWKLSPFSLMDSVNASQVGSSTGDSGKK